MSRSVTFNGQTRYTPGGITRVRTEGTARTGISAARTVAIIGEADGGAPGSSLVSSALPSYAESGGIRDDYRSGPLVDAARPAFASSGDPLVPGGAAEVITYKVNEGTQSSIRLPDPDGTAVSDTSDSGSTTTVIQLTTGGLDAGAYDGYWVDVTIAAAPGTPTYRRRITDTAAGALTVTPALPTAPASSDAVVIRPTLAVVTSADYGEHTENLSVDLTYDSTTGAYQATVNNDGVETVSPPLGGFNVLQVSYQGGVNDVAQDTVDTVATTLTATNIDLTTGSLTPSAHDDMTVKVTVPSTGEVEYHKIDTNGASDLTLESPGLSDDFLASCVAEGDGTVTVDILAVTDATAEVTGDSGAADTFATTITGVTGDDLSISITSTMTLSQLVSVINQNSNYVAEVTDAVNGDTTLAASLDFGTTATQVNIQKSIDVNGGLGLRRDLSYVVEWLDSDESPDTTAVRADDDSSDGAVLPSSESDIAALFATPFALVGGTRGTSTNSDWQEAFDALLTREVDLVVALIDQDLEEEGYGSTATWASVAQQFVDHVSKARTAPVNSERGGFIGYRGTKTEVLAAARSLQEYDIQVCPQHPTILNEVGTLEEFGPRIQAVMAASMRSGVAELGEPLTFKYLRAKDLTQDSSWNPLDTTDARDMIRAGVLFGEVVQGKGVRWVRDLTTWTRNDRLPLAEGSVRDIVRIVAKTLRTRIEDRYTGRKATPVRISSVKDTAATILEEMRKPEGGELIVDSTDPATGDTIHAWHSLKVTSNGDTVTLSVGVFPVPGINFQINDLSLQVPTQAA